MKTKKILEEKYQRNFIEASTSVVDDEKRLLKISFSSENAVSRYYGNEVLGHKEGEVNLERLNQKAPVMRNHYEKSIGVVRKAWIEGGRGHAEIEISKRSELDDLWLDIKDGIISNVSVGYKVQRATEPLPNEDGIEEYRVTRWTPYEISIVDIPADQTVGVNRSLESNANKEQIMPEDKIKDTTENRSHNPDSIDIKKIEMQAAERALEKEGGRQTEIRSLFVGNFAEYTELRDQCVGDRKVTVDQARKLLLDEMGKNAEPLQGNSNVRVGETDREKYRSTAVTELLQRGGIESRGDKPTGLGCDSLYDMARKCDEYENNSFGADSKSILIGRSLTSSSDYQHILSNVGNKSVMKGYQEHEEVFTEITSKSSLSDFKLATKVGIGEFSTLARKNEKGEYKHTSLSDKGESNKLVSYGRVFGVTRESIINDDLNLLTDVPRKMGRAAKRTVGNLVFDVLKNNPAMSDGTALFHADHKNLVTGAMSIAKFDAIRVALRTQVEQEDPLNIRPYAIVCPVALEGLALEIMESETDITQANSKKHNRVKGMAKVISEARLDADPAAFYVFADPASYDVIEVAYLDGNDTPFVESERGFMTDGVQWKVRIDAGVSAQDFRTMVKSSG